MGLAKAGLLSLTRLRYRRWPQQLITPSIQQEANSKKQHLSCTAPAVVSVLRRRLDTKSGGCQYYKREIRYVLLPY